MAQNPKSRHSGSSRKPTVIDHEPMVNNDVRNAENSANPQIENQEKSMSNTPQNSSSAQMGAKAVTVDEKSDPSASSSKLKNNEQKPTDNKTPNTAKKTRGGSFMSGVAGGVVALIIGAGLQWGGVLPAFINDKNLNQQIAGLNAQLKSLSNNDQGPLSNLSLEDQNKLISAAEIAKNQSNDAMLALVEMGTQIEALKTSITSIAANNGNPEALKQVMQKFATLDERLNVLANVSKEAKDAALASKKNTQDIGNLTTQFNTFSQNLEKPMQGKEIALLMAAQGLKNAVDRGGAYANELQTLKTIAPTSFSLDLLEKTAITGLPNQAILSTDFARVADSIAATENDLPNNAGIAEKLWASAKNLVVSRPVGNVEGTNPAAIAARMEVAIAAGDYEKALGEWQQLPPAAKNISSDFAQKLEARRDVDKITNQMIILSMQSTLEKKM